MASSSRIERINEEIMRLLSELLRQIKDPRINSGAMLSILRCETTNDLRHCKVSLSVLGEVDEKAMLKGLASAAGFLRRELGARMSLRYTPELKFVIDDSISHSVQISKMLRELDTGGEGIDDN